MIISKYSNNLIKIESPLLNEVIQNQTDYESLTLTGNINCCTDSFSNTVELPLTGFTADLSAAVFGQAVLFTISLKNLINGQILPIDASSIDLGYVADNCTVSTCTLETYETHFAPLFKNVIDSALTSPAAVVTFSGNNIIVTGIPSAFVMNEVIYNAHTIKFGLGVTDNDVYLGPDGLYVNPALFGLLNFVDGVYKFKLRIAKTSSFTEETNCAFIDVTMKCKVASTLHNIRLEAERAGNEKISSILHLLHYALVNGSNCGCNCDEMCKVFKELYGLLNNIDPLITNDCGC